MHLTEWDDTDNRDAPEDPEMLRQERAENVSLARKFLNSPDAGEREAAQELLNLCLSNDGLGLRTTPISANT